MERKLIGLGDTLAAVGTGLITGVVCWLLFDYRDWPTIAGIPWSVLPVAVPILFILGVQLGITLSRWLPFMHQFARFCAVGFTNTALDFGGLNFFIYLFGATRGPLYPVFKGASFVVCVTNAYLWNKYWTFGAASTGGGRSEFMRFLAVSVGILILDVGASTLVVNVIGAPHGVGEHTWANMGAAVGAVAAVVFNFLGQRLLVFRHA